MVLHTLNKLSFVYYIPFEIFEEFFKNFDLLIKSSYLSHLIQSTFSILLVEFVYVTNIFDG